MCFTRFKLQWSEVKWRSYEMKDHCNWWGGLQEYFLNKTMAACTIPAKLSVVVQGSLQAEPERKLLLQTCPETCSKQTPYMLNPHSVSRNNDSQVGISFFLLNLPELSVNQEGKFWRHFASQNNLSYWFSKRWDIKISCTHSWDSFWS